MALGKNCNEINVPCWGIFRLRIIQRIKSLFQQGRRGSGEWR